MSNNQWNSQHPRRDPRQPFGSPTQHAPTQPTSIESFQRPPTNTGRNVLIGLVVVAVVGALILVLQNIGSETEKPRPAASGPSFMPSSLGASANTVPFEGDGDGVFEVVSHTWESHQLVVRVRITVNSGTSSFEVHMFDDDTLMSHEPLDYTPITVTAGSPTEATVRFGLPTSNCTVVLTSSTTGDALAALPVRR